MITGSPSLDWWLSSVFSPVSLATAAVEVQNPDYARAITGSLPAASPSDLRAWEMLKPGEAIITGKFAGEPVVLDYSTAPESEMDRYLGGLPKNAFMPAEWTGGAAYPTTPQAQANLVRPYNPTLANELDMAAGEANLWGGVTSWLQETADKTLLIGGAVALGYLLLNKRF